MKGRKISEQTASNIVGETECISSHYSDELEDRKFGSMSEKEKRGEWALFDAMHLIKNNEKNKELIIRCGSKKNIANR